MTGNRVAPHDREAEIGVLGAVIHNNEALKHVVEILIPEYFHSPGNQRIYEAMLTLAREGNPIDEITLKAKLGTNGTSQVGGLPYIAELVDKTPVASNVAVYADVVLRKWRERQVVHEALKLARTIEEKGELNGQLEDFRKAVEPAITSGLPARGVGAREAMAGFCEWLESEEPVAAAKTFTKLDDFLYGLAPRKPTVIAARPGGGKTTLVGQCVVRNAAAGVPTLFFSLEMDLMEIIGRVVSAHTKIDGQKILHRQRQDFYDGDWDKISATTGTLAGLPFYVVAPPRPLNMDQIEAVTRNHIEKHGVQLVVIDHLRKIATGAGSIYEQQTKRICDVAAMAKALDVAVLVAAQINRAGEDKPGLSHLEGSGAIEQESQAVVILHDENPNSNEARYIEGRIVKNRNGRSGVVTLHLIPFCYTIK